MVQFREAKPSFGERFGLGLQPALQKSLDRFLDTESKKELQAQEYEFDKESYDMIKEAFGEQFANIWKASPTGARTALMQSAIKSNERREDLKHLFDRISETSKGKDSITEEQISEGRKQEFPKYKLQTEGMNPAEVVKYKKELRSYNSPVLTESIKANKALGTQANAVKDLEKLNSSKKLPKGLSRVFVDPKSGNIRPIAQMLQLVPPEAEQYVKIINDFTTQAKDSFGARVTNFELDRFMRRLPILSNSEKGRELILNRMRVNIEADKLYNDKLKEIYRHYGQDNITPEDADALAEQLTMDEAEKLRDQGVQIDEEMDAFSEEDERDKNEKLPKGMVLLLDPNGRPLHVPEKDVEKLIAKGARRG